MKRISPASAQPSRCAAGDDAGDIRFLFGIDARANLIALAERLPESAYGSLDRPEAPIKTVPPQRPERHKRRIVEGRGFGAIHTLNEAVAEFSYQPTACRRAYRVIVLRKLLAADKGQLRLFEKYRYFFFITNDRTITADEVGLSASGRRDQENLTSRLKAGVHALTTPADDLISNWAHMVMASPAWRPGLPCWCPSRRGMPRSNGRRSRPCFGWSSGRSARP